jgi:hypothetical protein
LEKLLRNVAQMSDYFLIVAGGDKIEVITENRLEESHIETLLIT